MYKCFEKNGGPYLKLGQMISQLHGFVPEEYCEKFAEMCDAAPASDMKHIVKTIEKEYGKPFVHIFIRFQTLPVAVGAIGQVHKAILRDTKEMVAVKV